MLPQHLVYKNELNREYVITLARNDETAWWWSEKIETCRNGFKCFKWKLYRCICLLVVEVVIMYVYCFVHRWSIWIIVQRDATQSSLFIILQVHSTCFGCQLQPSWGVHKTVTTASGTDHIVCAATSLQRGQASLATLEGGMASMTSSGGCSYSFVYSWWWVWLTPETCRVNLQNNK